MAPAVERLTGFRRFVSAVAIGAAGLLYALLVARLVTRADPWAWWAPLALGLGVAAADFASGVVHWAADTWGRDDLAVIGPRLLLPFRVHHVNPDDFVRRPFIDTNGEVAAIAVAGLAGFLLAPLETTADAVFGTFALAFCGAGVMTNQIHQWAHRSSPPLVIRMLQDCGLILHRAGHAQHHARPYDVGYCITTGWCNRLLDATGFFRALERVITRLTGVQPRHDDRRYEARYG